MNLHDWDPGALATFGFPKVNGACIFKDYVLCCRPNAHPMFHTYRAIFELPIPEINDCLFRKKLIILLQNRYLSQSRSGNTLARMLVYDNSNSKHMQLTWLMDH